MKPSERAHRDAVMTLGSRDAVADLIRDALARSLRSYEYAPADPLAGWRFLAETMRRDNPASAGLIDAAIRCAETGEPQPYAHGTVTHADPATGDIRYTINVPMERISLTLEVGPPKDTL